MTSREEEVIGDEESSDPMMVSRQNLDTFVLLDVPNAYLEVAPTE